MTSQHFNLCELRQIHATDFASEVSLTVGIVFIRVTCMLFEFVGFLYSGHVTFQIWSWLFKVKKTFNGTNMPKLQTQGSYGAQDMMVRSRP